MIKFFSCNRSALAVSAFVTMFSAVAMAANRDVPTQYPHIQDAINAAANGDEIRVANNFAENEAFVTLSGKSLTIRSYTPNFSAPAPGAKWDSFALGDVNSALLTISNASLTIEGFDSLSGDDCNVFYLESDVNLSIVDCVLTGTGRADTAGVKTAPNATNVSLNVDGTSITANGRGLWFNQVYGDTSMIIENCFIDDNASWPVAWQTNTGNHVFEMRDTVVYTRNNRAMRHFGFYANGTVSNNSVLYERCQFINLPTARYPISIAGVSDAADPSSTMVVTVRNCLFDLRDGDDNVETVAINSQDDRDDRRSEIIVDHCTIAFTGTNQCGFRLRENQSTLLVRNSILDAQGEGRVALRGWRGTIISEKNLLNALNETETASGGSVVLSGNEIIDQSAEFENWSTGDFRLTLDSPAVASGDDLGISDDLFGNSRPNPAGTNPDLGAIEFVASSSVSDWVIY